MERPIINIDRCACGKAGCTTMLIRQIFPDKSEATLALPAAAVLELTAVLNQLVLYEFPGEAARYLAGVITEAVRGIKPFAKTEGPETPRTDDGEVLQ